MKVKTGLYPDLARQRWQDLFAERRSAVRRRQPSAPECWGIFGAQERIRTSTPLRALDP